jgi:polysaccharide biosynthesis transport protein
MLQTNNVQPDIAAEPIAIETLSGAETLRSFMSFVRRQFSVILFVTLLALALGVIYVVTARPSYTAQAQLLIDARKVQVFQQQSILGDSPIDAAQVESQAEILKSENIASAVIKNLRLADNPEFVGSGGGLLGALFNSVSSGFGSDAGKVASDFENFRIAMRTFQERLAIKRLGLSYVIQIGFWSYSPERAAEIANAVADAYITDQLEAKYQATRRASVWLQDRIKELRDQVSAAERAVVDFRTQNNIVSTGGNDKRLLGEQQVAELTSQLVIARAHTAETKARLDRIESVLSRTDSPADSFGSTVTDTLKNEVVTKLRTQYLELAARENEWSVKYGHDHLAVVSLRNQMREIRNSIFEELKRLGETYKSDFAIAKQREVGVQQELAQAVSGSQATDAKSVTLRELQSTAQTYKTIYDNFLQRYMEAVQQQSFPITEARLISSASRPLNKSHPKILLDLAIACLGGIALGFGIGAFRDMADRVFRSGEQVESLLQTECIALVPLVTENVDLKEAEASREKPDSKNRKVTSRGQNEIWTAAKSLISHSSEAIKSLAVVSDLHGTIRSTKGKINSLTASIGDRGANAIQPSGALEGTSKTASRTIVRGSSAGWTTIDAPLSRYTEAIRAIKLANDLSGTVKSNRVVGFTSSLPNEGKSTIAFSLAQQMAQVGARTILVDCDLRNPSLTREFAPSAKTGLIEVMAGKTSLEEALWKDPSTKLAFLPVISKFRVAHSSEIVGSTQLRKLFEQLRESYDHIVVDLPPLAPIVDVRAATHLVDSFVFVIEWGQTKTDVVQHALGHAQAVYDNLLGVVLNKVDMNIFGRFAAHRDDVYYNKHYSRYGYTE